MLARLVLSVALFAGASKLVFAAPMSPEAKALLQQQCMGDFTAFCGDMPPEDGPETQACFERNMSRLSPGCKSAIQSYKQGKKG